jgi:signal transduction histidine kinase
MFTVIIFLIWLLEIVLFEPIYESVQKNQVQSVNTTVCENYETYDRDDYLDISIKSNCNIIIFKITNGSKEFIVNTTRNYLSSELEFNLNLLLFNLGTDSSTSYITKSYDEEVMNIGQTKVVDGETIYFYTYSSIEPISGATKVSTFILLIVSIISLVITVILSFVFSKKISKPIEELSSKAMELSKGNLNVEFDTKGFTEVERLSETLTYSIQEIKKSQEIQKEVIQNVSHELRTPLTLIESYAELINDYSGDNPQKRKEHIAVILEESKKLEYLINDMIDLSKMQAKTMEYKDENFNLADSLNKFEEYYKDKFKDFEFTFSYAKHIPLFADKKRIEQVIANLINNAINYSQKDERKIAVSVKKIAQQNLWRLSVEDHGIGISKQDQKLIFERHFRSTSAKRATTGSGIGLSIVREILNTYKFNFGVESELGKGSTFYFDFPESNKK